MHIAIFNYTIKITTVELKTFYLIYDSRLVDATTDPWLHTAASRRRLLSLSVSKCLQPNVVFIIGSLHLEIFDVNCLFAVPTCNTSPNHTSFYDQ